MKMVQIRKAKKVTSTSHQKNLVRRKRLRKVPNNYSRDDFQLVKEERMIHSNSTVLDQTGKNTIRMYIQVFRRCLVMWWIII